MDVKKNIFEVADSYHAKQQVVRSSMRSYCELMIALLEGNCGKLRGSNRVLFASDAFRRRS